MTRALFVLMAILALPATASHFEHYYCKVTGYTAGDFDLRQWGDDYLVQGDMWAKEDSVTTGNFELMIPVTSCEPRNGAVGTFRCVARDGVVIVGKRKMKFGKFELNVAYGEKENTYKPFQEKWPVWYQRLASVEFSGGDFRREERLRLATNVNYYNSSSASFRETCVMDGEVIKK